MLRSKLANILLYVPFSKEYVVPKNLQAALTQEEFFKFCYYAPDLDGLIKEISEIPDEGITGLEYPDNRDALIERFEEQSADTARLLGWLENSGIGVYAVCGDAGTGKTTYLEQLSFSKRNEYNFQFLNLAQAIPSVPFIGYDLEIPHFSSLFGKVLSIELKTISNKLFGTRAVVKNQVKISKRIKKFIDALNMYAQEFNLKEVLDNLLTFFNNLIADDDVEDLAFCKKCAKELRDLFYNLCKQNMSFAVTVAYELLQIVMLTKAPEKKHVFIFDNIERYIGTDEIFDDQIIIFMRHLRGIVDEYTSNYGDDYLESFQIIVAMRGTTLRMFTPQQISDFVEHKIDLSEWFPVEKILDLKIEWLNKNKGLLSSDQQTQLSQLMTILADIGRTGSVLRGLRLKLDSLFSHNKRLILDYVLSILESRKSRDSIKAAEGLLNNKNLPLSLRKHSYRSIIWRLICDQIRKDALYAKIQDIVIRNSPAKSNQPSTDLLATYLNYIRKILTILHNTAILGNAEIPFVDLINLLYPNHRDVLNWFLDKSCESERKKLAEILYILNYNNRHENHWFRYIDIQCNSAEINGIHISSANKLMESMFNTPTIDYIFIRITSAGEAYLGYIVQSFEQLSSFYFSYPPLFTTIPNINELMGKPVEDIFCARIVRDVTEKRCSICQKLNTDAERSGEIDYIINSTGEAISYSGRLNNSHNGYISNFCEVIKHYYGVESSEDIKKKLIKLDQYLRSYIINE